MIDNVITDIDVPNGLNASCKSCTSWSELFIYVNDKYTRINKHLWPFFLNSLVELAIISSCTEFVLSSSRKYDFKTVFGRFYSPVFSMGVHVDVRPETFVKSLNKKLCVEILFNFCFSLFVPRSAMYFQNNFSWNSQRKRNP